MIFVVLSLVLADFIADHCLSCHSDQSKAGGLTLARFEPTLAAVAEKVIRKVRAGIMPPPQSRKVDPAESLKFVEELEATMDRQVAKASPSIIKPPSRLNVAEYRNSVKSLLGVDLDAAGFLPADTNSNGFDTIADAQALSTTLLNGYLRAASEAARIAMQQPGLRGCNEPCAKRQIERLVKQAYRGFATPNDITEIQAFLATVGLQAAIRAILMSPRFLYRSDQAGDISLASRISYFLWSAPPDADLLRLAQSGVLHEPEVVLKEVKRMLADQRAVALSKRFAGQWLRLGELNASELEKSMRTETELFFGSIVHEDRSVLELLTAPYSFVDARLAKLYGLPSSSSSGFKRRTMPPSRGGLLGQASILATTSLPERTSPVLRGKWVMEVLLGIPPPPPPPNVPSLEDTAKPVRNGVKQTTRQRMELHAKNPRCNSCHRMIDPLGLALENFDTAGAWRDMEDGGPVNDAGEMYDGQKLAGIEGLRQALLARQDLVMLSFTENLMTYALGRRLEASDMPTVRNVIRQSASQNYRFSAFVNAIALSPTFRRSSNVLDR